MPKTRDSLAPLRELQTKAEGLVSKMDASIFEYVFTHVVPSLLVS